jgi:Mrp family chromosome partitioning ATPase
LNVDKEESASSQQAAGSEKRRRPDPEQLEELKKNARGDRDALGGWNIVVINSCGGPIGNNKLATNLAAQKQDSSTPTASPHLK